MLNPSMHYAIETFGHDMRALGNAEGAADACRDCLDIQTDQTVDVAQRVFRTCRHHSARIAYASLAVADAAEAIGLDGRSPWDLA